jgi:PLP dependent protein
VNQISENIHRIQEKIAEAAASCGRSADAVTLLAISKTFPPEAITHAMAAGLRRFGENRVQEAQGKILNLANAERLEWHLVGHLQSNKASRAAELFDVIESVDSIKTARRLNQATLEMGKTLPVLLQVKLGGEDTKSGAVPAEIREIVEAFTQLKGLRLDGLMTIPPFFENQEDARPYFAQLRGLAESLDSEQPGCLGRKHLSMGMSHDFEAAIREGATIVRIGTAIFGSRSYDEL